MYGTLLIPPAAVVIGSWLELGVEPSILDSARLGCGTLDLSGTAPPIKEKEYDLDVRVIWP